MALGTQIPTVLIQYIVHASIEKFCRFRTDTTGIVLMNYSP